MKSRVVNVSTFIFENDDVKLKAKVSKNGKVSYLRFEKKDGSEMYLYKDNSIRDNKDILSKLPEFTEYARYIDFEAYKSFYKSVSSVYKELFFRKTIVAGDIKAAKKIN